MRFLFSIILFSLFSCNSTPHDTQGGLPVAYATHDFILADSLGSTTFLTPERFDTSFSWIKHGDCTSCGDTMYRLQPTGRKVFKESGFYWYRPNDSIEQFTIEQSREIILGNDSFQINGSHHNHMKEKALVDLR